MASSRSRPGASPASAPSVALPAEASHIAETEDGAEAGRFVADAPAAGQRLDQFLTARLAGAFSRSRIQAVIESGGVRIDGRPVASPSRRLTEGETVEMTVPEAEEPDPQPEPIPLTILYEDEALIVIDKPAGLVVHPGAGNWTGTLVNALLHHCGDSLSGIGGVKRPGIVHRLDKDTSGVMVVAKTDLAHRSLSEQFAAHGRDGRMERAYLAVVWGVPARPKGRIEAALGRSSLDRLKRQVVPESRADARHAVTHYEVMARGVGDSTALLRCILETGRTHQIRVHMAHAGHPLIGDELYGKSFRTKALRLPEPAGAIAAAFPRQALHAASLGFEHPLTGAPLRFETAPPEDFRTLAEALELAR
ncbi:pseudouridine synthase [Aureimonas endophytica]|uniref:Pseudouridine synthase n=1 Tax=Aureimonas endophytica TaxID=2027858 RepID=A0A916ZGI6_9HYPH|nr:RluA family pseudouridine synthase [Aureimonas endophytica]GGD94239.1 pseudouridine synthase [Aureimonas endophytica]